MPGRTYNLNTYRYNYQGQESAVNSNWQDFELRMHNSDLGRFMAPDPNGQFASPYISMANNPISGTDPTGGFTNGGDYYDYSGRSGMDYNSDHFFFSDGLWFYTQTEAREYGQDWGYRYTDDLNALNKEYLWESLEGHPYYGDQNYQNDLFALRSKYGIANIQAPAISHGDFGRIGDGGAGDLDGHVSAVDMANAEMNGRATGDVAAAIAGSSYGQSNLSLDGNSYSEGRGSWGQYVRDDGEDITGESGNTTSGRTHSAAVESGIRWVATSYRRDEYNNINNRALNGVQYLEPDNRTWTNLPGEPTPSGYGPMTDDILKKGRTLMIATIGFNGPFLPRTFYSSAGGATRVNNFEKLYNNGGLSPNLFYFSFWEYGMGGDPVQSFGSVPRLDYSPADNRNFNMELNPN